MSVAREGQYGKGHTERTEAVLLKKACVGVGQRRLRLNLADGSPPTKSRQQHHKPHHGRPKSRTKTIQNRSKMCRKSSPNRSGTLRLAKIAFGRFWNDILDAKSAPGPLQERSWDAPGLPKAPGKRFWVRQGRSKTRLESS